MIDMINVNATQPSPFPTNYHCQEGIFELDCLEASFLLRQ